MKYSAIPLLLGLSLAVPAQAGLPAFNLVIDVSNPEAVTFTATSEGALGTHSVPVDFSGGITLENFFALAQSLTTGAAVTGNLTASGTTSAYSELVTFNYDAGTGAVEAGDDLSVYSATANGSDTQDFIDGTTAFSGAGTVDFTGYALPEQGAWGPINVGYKASQGGTIGYWTVVSSSPIPEPSSYALLAGAFALGGCVYGRRRPLR